MPNWCEGNMRLRGRPEAIIDFLKNEITCVARKPGSLDVVERKPDIEDFYGDITLKVPNKMDNLLWKCFYIKDTRRNFLDNEKSITVYVDKDVEIATAYIPDFKAAWAIKHEPYVEKSKKYGIDIKIFGFECGMEFEQVVEIVNGELIRDEEIHYDDWGWECPMSHMGG